MGDPNRLRALAAVERAATLPMLARLLEEVVPAEKASRGALESAQRDVGATEDYKTSVLIGALIRVVSAQQEQIDALERRLGEPTGT